MTERERIIDAFRNCITEPKCRCCPWDCDTIKNRQVDIPIDLALAVDRILTAQEPRVMTLEELEHAEVAYAEDKDKTDIIPVLVLGRMCDHVALVNPHVEEAITRMIIPRADEYGVRWRCWTSRPTDEQREAVPWG